MAQRANLEEVSHPLHEAYAYGFPAGSDLPGAASQVIARRRPEQCIARAVNQTVSKLSDAVPRALGSHLLGLID